MTCDFPIVQVRRCQSSMVDYFIYHNSRIQQYVSHGRNVLQYHTHSERSDDLQSLMQVLVFGQGNEVLVMLALVIEGYRTSPTL